MLAIFIQIFPMDMKAVAGSLVAITNWFTGWIVSYCFNFMLIWSQPGAYYGTIFKYFRYNYSSYIVLVVMKFTIEMTTYGF